MDSIDAEHSPFAEGAPSYSELTQAVESLILSASGWRKVCAADGDEESTTEEVSAADKVIAGTAALCFIEYLCRQGCTKPVVWIGCDSRPTGAALMDVMMRVLLSMGVQLKATFITAAPELMAATKVDPEADGFIYISASHNPIGHNGFKFGGANGAVLGGDSSAELIVHFEAALHEERIIEKVAKLTSNADPNAYRRVLDTSNRNKQSAAQSYSDFTRRVVSGYEDEVQQAVFFDALSDSLRHTPIGILGELNGSARSTSIDRSILENSGFLVEMHNDSPGRVVHRIVPEGSSLDLCRELLAKAHTNEPAFTLGYVPDNDGDRGNIVFVSENTPEPRQLSAQEVFALAVLAELAYQQHFMSVDQPTAVVVNGPTSMRIERIARAFGAQVWRAEVGEANVVNLAEELRSRGYRVRILGEGSNGGNITHPSTVRDPLCTIYSLAKLLAFRGEAPSFNPYRQWCLSEESRRVYTPGFTIADILESLPPFSTTSAYEPEAKMQIKTRDQAALKRRWEHVFLQEWEGYRGFLQSEYDIVSWREINYEGTEARPGFGPQFRSGSEKGGLKIVFSNSAGEDTDFIWMRGSGTEPVFRVLADSYGADRRRHDWLLEWHRSMIESADSI
ncbi:MAG: hypothetical protein ACOCW5_01245 [Spirochaetia bacterium]